MSEANEIPNGMGVPSVRDSLVVAAAVLTIGHADTLTPEESRIVDTCNAPRLSRPNLAETQDLIRAGRDPLGTVCCHVRSAKL